MVVAWIVANENIQSDFVSTGVVFQKHILFSAQSIHVLKLSYEA